jgi:hypothetical protein
MVSIRRKSWQSFSLKTLLLAMTVLAIVLGLYVKSYRDRRSAIDAINGLDAWLSIKHDGPQWLHRFVSDEKYFWNPVAVRFNPDHPVTDAELQSVMKHLMTFKDLRYLNFYRSRITDAGLAQLFPLSDKLDSLDIRNTSVSDNGIAHLKQLHRLTLLRLSDSKISPEGVETIRKSLPNCKLE